MKKLLQFMIVCFLMVGMCGCRKPTFNGEQNVGGWLGNDDHSEETNDQNDNHQSNGSNKGGIVVDTIEYNTDAMHEGVYVEVIDYMDKYILFKVTNESNNCYRNISTTIYFNCDPLPERRPLEDDEEYHNYYSFYDIPAYSITYHYGHAFGEEMSTDKGGNFDGFAYYPFVWGSDPYRIVLREFDGLSGSILSDDLIQDASGYIALNTSSKDLGKNKFGTTSNSSARHVEFSGFAVFSNGEIIDLQNGSEFIDSVYENIIPASGVEFKTPGNGVYDCNSVYSDPYDASIPSGDYRLYLNYWFNDEVE